LAHAKVHLRPYHSGQQDAWDKFHHYTLLRCGRRFGKSELGVGEACLEAVAGGIVGWFAPDYRRLVPSYDLIRNAMREVIKTSSKTAGEIRFKVPCSYDSIKMSGVDFWTLNDENAGRGRAYSLVVIDEAAFGPSNLMEIWQQAIEPTLLDYNGRALVMSNTNGIDAEQFFWRIANEPEHGFGPVNEDGTRGYHAPTWANPLMSRERVEQLRASRPPLVFAQEYGAEFVDWSGFAFFELDKLLGPDRTPTEMPTACDTVFAIVDTATKTGRDCDGTAVCYFALTQYGTTPQLVILDWDITQIEGAMLETWLPTVFQNLEHYALMCGARAGVSGTWIEDKSSGMVLLQHATNKGWPAQAIDSRLTSVGKDERAIAVSSKVYQGMVKLSRLAFEKTVNYKGSTKNHLTSQVVGFRVGDKDAAKRADDLLDTFCYGIALGLGDQEGF
jgi:hypothetical protein